MTRVLKVALSTDKPAEALNAVEAIKRLLRGSGLELHDVIVGIGKKAAKSGAA